MALPYRPSAKTAEAIVEFARQSARLSNTQWNLRQRFEDIDRLYQRETDLTEDQWKSKQANIRGDADKFQNIVLPIVMPQVETAVTYQQSVFLTGYPIFGTVASPAHADAATQMDTIIGEQQIRGKWVAAFIRALRNGFKYNLGPVEVSWDRQTSYALETPTSAGEDEIDAQKEVIWEGNVVRDLDPYNTFWDSRVSPNKVASEGEFAGYVELKSRIALKQLISELPTRINIKEALESGYSGMPVSGNSSVASYYVPQINPNSLYEITKHASTDWHAWAGIANDGKDPRIKYRNMYEVTTLYGRILPEDFAMTGIPAASTPQVWKFIIVNNQTVIYAERLTNVHNLIPIFFCTPHDDGLAYQTKSLAQNVEPFQSLTSALSNSLIAARRRSVSDRMIFDPSRVSAASIRSDSPVARIPVRPSAYGTPMSEAVHQIPFRDEQSAYTMQAVESYFGMTDNVTGFNQTRRGQFVKGNKTRFEFEETMANANGRDHTIAMMIEAEFFASVKEVIKANILQYQGGVSVFNREMQEIVQVDPVLLRQAQLEFKISDGLLPSDKLIDGESLAMAFQTIAQAPELAAGFNVAPMFTYLMKSRGAKIQPFEKGQAQIAYEQAVAQWSQAVQIMVETIMRERPDISMEEIQQALPPQPTPEQFGYDPEAPEISQAYDGKSVMDRYTETAQAQAQVMQQNAGMQGTQGAEPQGGEGEQL